jgi:hypothetical protein
MEFFAVGIVFIQRAEKGLLIRQRVIFPEGEIIPEQV